jgi:hypothetical protein
MSVDSFANNSSGGSKKKKYNQRTMRYQMLIIEGRTTKRVKGKSNARKHTVSRHNTRVFAPMLRKALLGVATLAAASVPYLLA